MRGVDGSIPASILLPSFLYSYEAERQSPFHSLMPKVYNNFQSVQSTCIPSPPIFGILQDSALNASRKHKLKMADTKIAIIGGGLCGVTAAHAIKERLEMLSPDDHSNVQIVIYEADPNSFNEGMKFRKSDFEKELQPEWRAATSRNANSLGN